jgi:hypothetical protein
VCVRGFAWKKPRMRIWCKFEKVCVFKNPNSRYVLLQNQYIFQPNNNPVPETVPSIQSKIRKSNRSVPYPVFKIKFTESCKIVPYSQIKVRVKDHR